MKSNIEKKVEALLVSGMPFTQECQVVYLLVEIRKILDHEKSTKYPLLRFYADWSVHTEKDRITKQIETIMKALHKKIIERLSMKSFADPNPVLTDFVIMKELRNEIDLFLREHGLPDSLVYLKINWPSFQALLASILADQPINQPCPEIIMFSFKPAAPGCYIAEIECEKTPAVYETLTLRGEF